MIRKLVIFIGILILSEITFAEALIGKDISINASTLSFSKNIPFSYCFDYEEECVQATAGEEVSFSVAQHAVFRWGSESASYKLSFSPLLNSTKHSSMAY